MFKAFGVGPNQEVSESSIAIQAGRDVHYHGLSLADVQGACALFFESNFPKLQERAYEQAARNVEAFTKTMAADLERNAAHVLVDKFSDPDVQAALNDAVKACARKGEAANPATLSQLIVARMGEANSRFLDVALTEAVTVVPKLTGEQLAFVALVHAMKNFKPVPLSVEALEANARQMFSVLSPAFGLSDIQCRQLVYAGVASVSAFTGNDFVAAAFEGWKAEMKFADVGEFKAALDLRAPMYGLLIKEANALNVLKFELNGVGHAIALTMLAPRFVPRLDYSIWLH